MKKLITTLALGALLAFPAASAAETPWYRRHTPESALAAARAEQKDVLTVYRSKKYRGMASTHNIVFECPALVEALRARYVVSMQDMPADAPGDAESAFVFADADGHPYYCFDREHRMGTDWLLEELAIAAERKAAVQALRATWGASPTPEQLLAFFAAMPLGIERFDASYRALMQELDGQGDAELAARRADAALRLRIIVAVNDALKEGKEPEFSAEEEAAIEALPQLRQFYSLRSNEKSFIAAAMAGQHDGLRAFVRSLVAMEPRSKCSRHIVLALDSCLRCAEIMIELSPYYCTEPERALRRLAERRREGTPTYAEQQVIGMLEGRVLAELGQWDDALAALRRAQDCDPVSDNARNAGRLIVSLLMNREELERLLPLRRRGDEAVDARWDTLLGITVSSGIYHEFSNLDLYFGK